MAQDENSPNAEPVAFLIGRGRILDFLTRLAMPVAAIPPRNLYSVLVHGRGIQLVVQESNPIVGFHVTFYIAARTADDATERALLRARDRWETFYPEANGQLDLAVEQVKLLDHRFVRRSRTGFVFYCDENETLAD